MACKEELFCSNVKRHKAKVSQENLTEFEKEKKLVKSLLFNLKISRIISSQKEGI